MDPNNAPSNHGTHPVHHSVQVSLQTQTSLQVFPTESDTYYDFVDILDDLPIPNLSKLTESSSSTTLLQRIVDPQQFTTALRGIVHLAESLLKALEDTAGKCRRSITNIVSPKATEHEDDSRCDNRDEEIRITAEPISVTVPLTLHVKPKVIQKWLDVESGGISLVESLEPIRTSCISGTPRVMHFYTDPSEQIDQNHALPELELITAVVGNEDIATAVFESQKRPLPQQKKLITPPAEKDDYIDRPGASQNDRHRDHSNLSNQPNTETCTGRRQQPAGPKQNQEAKDDDYNDNDDKDKGNEQTSTNQYSTPRGSCLSLSEEFNDESDDLTPNGGKVQQMVPEIHRCWCGDPGNCLGTCSQSVDRYEQSVTGTDSSCLEMPEKSVSAAIIDPLIGRHSLTICTSFGKEDFQKRRNSFFDYSSPESSLITLRSKEKRRSIGTAITPRESLDSQHLTLLTNIYELLQSIRDDQILPSSARHVLRKAAQTKESLDDLHFLPTPPPPPSLQSSAPSTGKQMQSSSLDISSRISRQSDSSTLLAPDEFGSLRQSPSFFFDEPPERDLELDRSVYRAQQRLVPLDMELLGVDYDFELEPQKDPEFQVNGTILYDVAVESEPKTDTGTGISVESQVTTIESEACEPQIELYRASLECQIDETPFYDVIVEFPSSEEVVYSGSHPYDAIIEIYPPEDHMDAVDQDSLESRQQQCCEDLAYSKNFSDRGSGEDRSSKAGISQTPQIVQFPRIEDSNNGRPAASDLYTDAKQERSEDSGECVCEEPENFSGRGSGYNRSSKAGISQTPQVMHFPRSEDSNNGRPAVSDLNTYAKQERPEDSGECVSEEPEKCVCGKTIFEDSCLKEILLVPHQEIEVFEDLPEPAILEDVHLNAPSLQSMIISNQQVSSNGEHGFSQEIQLKTESLISPLEQPIMLSYDDENIDTTPSVPGQSNTDTDRRSCSSCCHNKKATAEQQNPDACDFIDSILSDLEAMKEARDAALFRWQSQQTQSFPVTIETVQALEPDSLFIKWKVHDIANISGYEIFLDGWLTNRYFNRVHRAAVICDVNLQSPHRITLRAQSQIKSKCRTAAASTCKCPPANTNPEIRQPQPDGSIWYPSVFNYEPNFLFSTS